MVVGIGIDIEKIDRFDELTLSEHLKKKIFLIEEEEYGRMQKEKQLFYAGNFAAKEAVIKSISQASGQVLSFDEILIIRNPKNPPQIKLLSDKMGDQFQLLLSISHDKDTVVAVCITQTKYE